MPLRTLAQFLRLTQSERDEIERQQRGLRDELLQLGMPLEEVDALLALNAAGRLDWEDEEAGTQN